MTLNEAIGELRGSTAMQRMGTDTLSGLNRIDSNLHDWAVRVVYGLASMSEAKQALAKGLTAR